MIGGKCKRCNVKGMRFQPTEQELMDYHLKPKILDTDSHHHYIGDIQDLTEFEPSDLFRMTQKNPDDRDGYFFWAPRYKKGRIVRKGKNGFWSETGTPVSITGEEELGGKKRVFVFCNGVYPGTRTAWFINQFEITASLPTHHQGIFLCKLFEQKQKRKAENNGRETSGTPKRARKDDSSRKKAKEAQLGNEDLASDGNKKTMSSEALPGSQSLPCDPDPNILISEVTPQSHHLSPKHFSENISNTHVESVHHFPANIQNTTILTKDTDAESLPLNFRCHPCGIKGSCRSYGFPSDDIQNLKDNQQSHHLPSNSIINTSTCVEMQPSHHLPSNYKESIVTIDAYEENQSKFPPLEGCSLDWDDDANHHLEFNIEVLAAQLKQPQPTTTPEVYSCNELPPSSDLNRGADKFQDQRGNSEEEDFAYFLNSLPPIEDIKMGVLRASKT